MLSKVLISVAVIIGGFLIYIALQPGDFLVSREIMINAKPEVIFPYINNSQKANEWMPWKDSDPTAQMVYSGPTEGAGSMTSWDSPGKMGTGNAVVVESNYNQSVKTKLTYTKPMNMSQMAEISLVSRDNATLVRWSVTGQNSFMGRVFCFFMNMDKMVGGEFEKGLSKLKSIVEKGS